MTLVARRAPYETIREHVGDRWRHGYRATCAATGIVDTLYSAKALPPEGVAKLFAARGWRADPKRATGWFSPAASASKEKNDPMSKLKFLPDVAQAPAPHPVLLRKIMLALGDHFDAESGKWSGGASDESVAKSLDCAPAVVTRVRREYFGEEAVPSELAQISADVEAVKGMVRDLDGRLTAALQRYRR